MALIGIAILLLVLIPLIVAGAMLAAALLTLGRLLRQRERIRTASAPALVPLAGRELANEPATPGSLR